MVDVLTGGDGDDDGRGGGGAGGRLEGVVTVCSLVVGRVQMFCVKTSTE